MRQPPPERLLRAAPLGDVPGVSDTENEHLCPEEEHGSQPNPVAHCGSSPTARDTLRSFAICNHRRCSKLSRWTTDQYSGHPVRLFQPSCSVLPQAGHVWSLTGVLRPARQQPAPLLQPKGKQDGPTDGSFAAPPRPERQAHPNRSVSASGRHLRYPILL